MHPLGSDTTQHAIKLVASETQMQPKLVQTQVVVQNVCNPCARSNTTFQTHFNIHLALARSTDVRNMMVKRRTNGFFSLPLIQHGSTSSYSLILATVSRQCFHGSWESPAGVVCLYHAHTTPTNKRPLSHSGWRRGSFYGGWNTTEALCGQQAMRLSVRWTGHQNQLPGWRTCPCPAKLYQPAQAADTPTPTKQGRLNYTELYGWVTLRNAACANKIERNLQENPRIVEQLKRTYFMPAHSLEAFLHCKEFLHNVGHPGRPQQVVVMSCTSYHNCPVGMFIRSTHYYKPEAMDCKNSIRIIIQQNNQGRKLQPM